MDTQEIIFKDYTPSKNSDMPIFTFYMYYMIIFAIYLLPTIFLFAGQYYGTPPWPITLLHGLYLPQAGLMQLGMAIVDSTVVGYLVTLAFYAVFLCLTICLRRRKESKANRRSQNV